MYNTLENTILYHISTIKYHPILFTNKKGSQIVKILFWDHTLNYLIIAFWWKLMIWILKPLIAYLNFFFSWQTTKVWIRSNTTTIIIITYTHSGSIISQTFPSNIIKHSTAANHETACKDKAVFLVTMVRKRERRVTSCLKELILSTLTDTHKQQAELNFSYFQKGSQIWNLCFYCTSTVLT